jgi:hypothetical protein
MITHWLLIGGPAHGRILGIKGGSQVRYPGDDGEEYLYVGQTFVYEGKGYRIGRCFSEGGDKVTDHEVAALIADKRPSAIEPKE